MIKGLYSVLVTPFDDKNQVDHEGFCHNIQFQLSHKVDGIVILGTTGEAPTLSSDEQKDLIKIAKAEINGRVPLMVGTGSYSTQETIEKTLSAETLGADQALIVTPYYNKPTQEGMLRHFQAIARATSLPIMIYNIAGRTGQNLQTETLKRLADIPTIVGVKEASGNINQMMEVIESIGSHRRDFSVMCGDDALTLPLMSLGGHGVLSVVSNLIPHRIKALVDAAGSGNFALAREIHYELLPLFRAAFIETNPIPIKAAMNAWEFPAGNCRLPLCEMQPDNLLKLQHILSNYDQTKRAFGKAPLGLHFSRN